MLFRSQLWASFQNAACCITKLYRDRTQPNVSSWIPFQNAASNLTTLYKDCIESQRLFAKLGYQVGRQRRSRELRKLLKKHQVQSKSSCSQRAGDINQFNDVVSGSSQSAASNMDRRNYSAVASILAVNQLKLDCDEMNAHPNEAKNLSSHQYPIQQQHQSFQSNNGQQQQPYDPQRQHHSIISESLNSHHNQQQQQQQSLTALLGNNEEDLVAFQQALVQPISVRSVKMGHNNRRPSVNSVQSAYTNNRSIESNNVEEDRLLELNKFLSEEYHRHVGSRKRSCTSIGGGVIKRARE